MPGILRRTCRPGNYPATAWVFCRFLNFASDFAPDQLSDSGKLASFQNGAPNTLCFPWKFPETQSAGDPLFSFLFAGKVYRPRFGLGSLFALQPKVPSAEAGAGPVAERARADEFDAVGGPCGEASEVAIAVLHGALKVGLADSPEPRGLIEHDVCARLCVCGTDVVVLCAGLPAGTEDVTAAAAAAVR